MKIWLDKHGGMHYHKEDCKIMEIKHPNSDYEEIEHRIRKYKHFDEYTDIIVEGRRYIPCPFCF